MLYLFIQDGKLNNNKIIFDNDFGNEEEPKRKVKRKEKKRKRDLFDDDNNSDGKNDDELLWDDSKFEHKTNATGKVMLAYLQIWKLTIDRDNQIQFLYIADTHGIIILVSWRQSYIGE